MLIHSENTVIYVSLHRVILFLHIIYYLLLLQTRHESQLIELNCESTNINLHSYWHLPATDPRMPGMPWTYVISCIPVLVHNGLYFWMDHETTDDMRPMKSPMINDAHTSTDPEDALTPDKQDEKKKRKFFACLVVILSFSYCYMYWHLIWLFISISWWEMGERWKVNTQSLGRWGNESAQGTCF